jgi:hypothetical protein
MMKLLIHKKFNYFNTYLSNIYPLLQHTLSKNY